jgi:hypothetical protein
VVTPGEAVDAMRLAEAELDRLEPLEVVDDELGWAGSHE